MNFRDISKMYIVTNAYLPAIHFLVCLKSGPLMAFYGETIFCVWTILCVCV